MKILILASNPHKDLNLSEEIRDLQGVIDRSRHREQFEVEVGLAVRPKDLQGLLLKHEPQIVHFCGHGTGEQGLVLQDESGCEQVVSTEALKGLFELFADRVECVLLNACYSEQQADAIVEHINYVIGMSQEILDAAAIAFATGFYGALGYGRSIEESYKFGCNQIHLTHSGFGNTARRSGFSKEQRKAEVLSIIGQSVNQIGIPEHLKPKLKRKSNLTTVSNPIGVSSSQRLSSNEQVELQLTIDRTYDREIAVKQYREKVREFLSDRKLDEYEEIRLDQLRRKLELSVEETTQILEEEQQLIQQSRDDYQEMLIQLIERGHYPFDPATEVRLQNYCKELQLTEEEVEAIAKPILEEAEEKYQEKLRQQKQQEYQAKLQTYEQEFSRAIDSQYPIDSAMRNQLKNLQQELELTDEAVARLEEPIIASKEAACQQQLEEQRERERQKEQEQQRQRERQRQREEQRKQEEAERQTPPKAFESQSPAVQTNNTKRPSLFSLRRRSHGVDSTPAQNAYGQVLRGLATLDLGNGVTLEMVAIPGGSFMMGSPSQELERSDAEGPQHQVTVPRFWMGKFAVTQAQWKAIAAMPKVNRDLEPDPSGFKGDRLPVEQVPWYEAVEFCDRLTQKRGGQYRLPSEAEWEYACRAGTTTPFYCGETIATDLANYDGNSIYGSGTKGVYRQQTTEVGSFPANAFGLYDMHGNVWEWCLDHWHENYQGAPIDGSAWIAGGNSSYRLLRGGSWYHDPWNCRSAFRSWGTPDFRSGNYGFRVVCSALDSLALCYFAHSPFTL